MGLHLSFPGNICFYIFVSIVGQHYRYTFDVSFRSTNSPPHVHQQPHSDAPSQGEHHQPMMGSSGSCSAALRPGMITEINFLTLQWTSKKRQLPSLEKKFPCTQVFQIEKKKKEFVNIRDFSLWLYFTEENFQNSFDFYYGTNIMKNFFKIFF